MKSLDQSQGREREKGCVEMKTSGPHSHLAGAEILTNGQVIIMSK